MGYAYRGWIFPFNIRVHNGAKNFSMVPAFFSWFVTSLHAYLNARWFSTFGTHLADKGWFRRAPFVIGASLYYAGLALIVWHDTILRELRPCPDGERYCIPHEGLFSQATCAQYFAELVAWLGFGLMSSGPNGLFIFTVSLVNLVPRAAATHAWYVDKFGDDY